MKLSGRAASSYFAKPETNRAGLLIFGADAMRVALKRAEVILALIGPDGDRDMRLDRIPAAELRRDPSQLIDKIKEQGFFAGPRVAFVEDATDGLGDVIAEALNEWREGDAQIIVTAGNLNARSKLRKAFEGHPNAYAAGIYNDPPTREEIEAELQRAGLPRPDTDAMQDLTALSRAIDPGDFRQTIEKLALYKLSDGAPLNAADIAACAPATMDADLDDVLNIVAEARVDQIGPVMVRLEGQGMTAVSLVIGAMRHFRALHAAAADPGGPEAGIGRLRPPVFGPRRDRMAKQARSWGMERLETALSMLTDTDLQLRSAGQHAPAMALVERQLIRLAMLARRSAH